MTGKVQLDNPTSLMNKTTSCKGKSLPTVHVTFSFIYSISLSKNFLLDEMYLISETDV